MDYACIIMTDTLTDSSNILFVTQRLSDFIEMKRAAISLKGYGYRCIILFCGVGSKNHDDLVIHEIDKSLEAHEIDEKIIFSQSRVIIKTPIHKVVDYLAERNANKEQINEKIVENHHAQKLSNKIKIIRNTKIFLRRIYNFMGRLVSKFENRLKKLVLFFLKISNKLTTSNLVLIPLNYKNNLISYKDILKQYQIKLIILPEDIVGNVSPLLIKAGHACQVPSMILPYTIANQSEAFQSLKSRSEFSLDYRFINRVVGILFRSWVMKDKSHAVLRLPAEHVLGHVFTRSSPPDPWMMNSGYANVIAVENHQMFKYYHRNGIPVSKMKVTGACYDDNLAGFLLDKVNQREKLYAELNIKTNKPFLLIGGFPNQLIGNPPGFDFENAEEAVDFIADCLQPFYPNYEIIFRPHPNYLELADLFAKRNFLITHIDTARLVALSDIYIAFASATIRWAISCGVPTINYDIFYYDFSDYKQVKGVLNVCSKIDFSNAVAKLSQQEQLISLKNHLETEKLEWGQLDGQSVNRINLVAQELIQLKKVRRKAS